MRNRKSTDTIAVLTTGAALAAMLLASWELGPPVDRRLHSEIGRVLAKEALSLSRPGGEIIVITRDTEAFQQPALDILLKSFRREVNRAGDITLTTKSLQLDSLRPVEVPPGDFYELIRRSNDERVIVSLLGPPALTGEQRRALGQVKPKIIALCTGNLAQALDLRELFDSRLLHIALVNQPPSRGGGGASASGPVTFDQLYTVVRGDLSPAREPASARR